MGTAYLRGDFKHTVVRAGGRGGAHSRVMLVGHNPGMEWLTDFLAGGFEDPSEKRFPTAGLGVLELEHAWDDLKPGCARSVRVIRPRELVPD